MDYQSVLNELTDMALDNADRERADAIADCNKLQELIDKEKPMKVAGPEYETCPKCGAHIDVFHMCDPYCAMCGQKLKWPDATFEFVEEDK